MSNQEDHTFQSQEPKINNQILTKKSGNRGKNNNSKPETIYNKCYTETTKYDERVYGKNGCNV